MSDRFLGSASKKKLLTFSDGRQDAAFFASAYQRDRTEIVYRQILWQTFQTVKDSDGVASVTQLINQLKQYPQSAPFLCDLAGFLSLFFSILHRIRRGNLITDY